MIKQLALGAFIAFTASIKAAQMPGYIKSEELKAAENTLLREELAQQGYVCPNNNPPSECQHDIDELKPKSENHDIVTPPAPPINNNCTTPAQTDEQALQQIVDEANAAKEKSIHDLQDRHFARTGQQLTFRDGTAALNADTRHYDDDGNETGGGCSVQ